MALRDLLESFLLLKVLWSRPQHCGRMRARGIAVATFRRVRIAVSPPNVARVGLLRPAARGARACEQDLQVLFKQGDVPVRGLNDAKHAIALVRKGALRCLEIDVLICVGPCGRAPEGTEGATAHTQRFCCPLGAFGRRRRTATMPGRLRAHIQ
eukprot:scaffold48979_cov29-Tisochrysis_lutea.AAC.5